MIIRKLTIFITGLLFSVSLSAQDNFVRQIYEQAEEEFAVGRIDQTVELLQENMSKFKGTVRQSAYRLLTLCALAQDDDEQAGKYANLLLDENLYYTPSAQDPQLFVELINRLRATRSVTITTASKMAESLEEAPVPVTLITEEMIRQSTATNLQELLAEYVPGMTVQEGRETVVGMRGIFSTDQEYILIMRDGVRLNSHISNSIPADARIALSNIKQIEVLRGPASSLYGNVALSAVVNIITKSGASVEGVQASVGAGSMHTLKGDLIVGRQLHDADLLIWGSVYKSRGYRYDFPADSKLDAYHYKEPADAYIYVNGFNHPPAYDLGLRYNNKDFELYFSHQHGKRGLSYTTMFNSSYPYDRFTAISGTKPGVSLKSSILNLRYGHTWNKWAFEANATGSLESSLDNEPTGIGLHFFVEDLKLYCIGADAKIVYNYPSTTLGKGNVLVGMQAESYKWYSYQIMEGDGDKDTYAVENDATSGMEHLLSVFSQLKHEFSPYLILNAGIRYDYKERKLGHHINQISPRAALIWSPSKNTNFKLAYGHSFVDLAVTSRTFYLNLSQNSLPEIHPNKMDNIQLSGTFNFPQVNLRYETCLFYNYTEKIRLIDFSFITKDDKKIFNYFDTSIKSLGWENTLSYERKGFKARLSTYLQRIIDCKSNSFNIGSMIINDIPDINTCPDLTMDLHLSKSLFDNLWVTANGTFQTKQYYSYFPTLIYNLSDPDWHQDRIYSISQPAYFKLDLGASYRWKMLDVSLRLKNIFNKRYRLNGEQSIVMQPGRTFLGTLTVHF